MTSALGIPHRVAVQVKMWTGKIDDLRPLTQIEEAANSYDKIGAGLVITMGDGFTQRFESTRAEMEGKLNIPIIAIGKTKLLRLFLKYFPDFSEPSADE